MEILVDKDDMMFYTHFGRIYKLALSTEIFPPIEEKMLGKV
jgi:hypothetical protein